MGPVRENWENRFTNNTWDRGKKDIKRVFDAMQKYDVQLGKEVLDIGSGHGRHSLPLARNHHNVTCLELTTTGLDKTEEKLEKEGLKANLIQGDHQHLPLGKERFDSVISIQSFQYCRTPEELEQSFSEANGALKPGGIFILRVRSEKFNKGNHMVYDKDGNLESRGISLEELLSLVGKYNMEILEQPFDSHEDDEEGNVIKEGQWNIVMRKKK